MVWHGMAWTCCAPANSCSSSRDVFPGHALVLPCRAAPGPRHSAPPPRLTPHMSCAADGKQQLELTSQPAGESSAGWHRSSSRNTSCRWIHVSLWVRSCKQGCHVQPLECVFFQISKAAPVHDEPLQVGDVQACAACAPSMASCATDESIPAAAAPLENEEACPPCSSQLRVAHRTRAREGAQEGCLPCSSLCSSNASSAWGLHPTAVSATARKSSMTAVASSLRTGFVCWCLPPQL